MDLKLDPPSGFADSYFDIEFLATFTKAPKSVITFHNDTSDEHLDIVGVAMGYILHGNSAVVKDMEHIQGHFNLFNNDKMNKKFNLYGSVKIRCKVEHFDENDKPMGEEEENLIFYNESLSLDAEIIPFDIVIHNNEIELGSNDPLKIDIISGLPKSYTISIKSADDQHQCELEISAIMGRTTIEIPAALLAYDLDLKSHGHKKFYIYYAKYQGTNLSRLANKTLHKIDNTQLSFSKQSIGLQPQARIDPCGRVLSNNFIVSDRYLVLCPREYSGFAPKSEFSPEKFMDLTMLTHEAQHMENLENEIRAISKSDEFDKINKTQKAIQQARHTHPRKIRPKINSDQIQLMRSISGAYESIISRPVKNGHLKQVKAQQPKNPQAVAFSTASQPKKPCAPCARKKNNA